MLAVFNSEARFPIKLIDNLGGVIFYDGGNVFSAISASQFTQQLHEQHWFRFSLFHEGWPNSNRLRAQPESRPRREGDAIFCDAWAIVLGI